MKLRTEVDAALSTCVRRGLGSTRDASVLHGNGNVIAVIEITDDVSREALSVATQIFCDAVRTLRIDGVLFFQPEGRRMTFFDRDGTWEAMCGNGLRCVTRYAYDSGHIDEVDTILTEDGPKDVRITEGAPEVVIGEPREVKRLGPDRWFLYNGVAHVVIFRDRVDDVDVVTEGRRLRFDRDLCAGLGHPEGVHVNFVAVEGGGVRVRTYEVGVEDETLSCGTGVAASGYAGWAAGRTPLPVDAYTAGGTIRVARRGNAVSIRGEVGYLLMRATAAGDRCEPARAGAA
jgi:diaminopimelate epimerase